MSDDLIPYLLEAGVDVELLHTNRKLIIQGLLIFNVVEKRKLELDDIAKGTLLFHCLLIIYLNFTHRPFYSAYTYIYIGFI